MTGTAIVGRIRRAFLVAMLLVTTLVQPGLGRNSDQARIAVVIEHGAPIRASVSFLASPTGVGAQAGTGTLVTSILDSRGVASGWTARLETHGGFRAEIIASIDRYGHVADAITVRQGNRNLIGHSVIQYGSVLANDACRWTAIRHFGDGEYDLLLTGTVIRPSTGASTIILTISGSAP